MNNQPEPPPVSPPRASLRDIIQMECLGRNSSVLEIYNETELGRIYIRDGDIIHAAIDALQGMPAFQKLLDLPGGEFELVTFEPPEERTLTLPWASLLNEALRARTESAASTAAAVPGVAAGADGGDDNATGPRVVEKLICSAGGEVLYETHCADVSARKAWLQTVVQQASALGQILPLGHFDRMDIAFADERSSARVRADALVYLRVVRGKDAP